MIKYSNIIYKAFLALTLLFSLFFSMFLLSCKKGPREYVIGINLKTAQASGIEIPLNIVKQAEFVIR